MQIKSVMSILERIERYAKENNLTQLTRKYPQVIVVSFDSLKSHLKFSVNEEYEKITKEFTDLYTFLMVQSIYISCKQLKTGWSYRVMQGATYAHNKAKYSSRFPPLTSIYHYKKTLLVLFREPEDIQVLDRYQFNTDITERLSKEIHACYEARSSISEEESIRKEITDFLTKELQKAFNDPELAVEQTKSTSNYLDNEGVFSLSIRIPQNRFVDNASICDNTSEKNSVFNVHSVAKHLGNMGMEAILPMPLASRTRFTHPSSALQCTIGVDSSFLFERSQLISEYLDLDSRIRPLVFLIIQFTKLQNINKFSRNKALSSYSYIFMMLHYLMNVISKPLIPNIQKEIDGCESLYCNYNNIATGLTKIYFNNQVQTVDIRYHSCIQIINNDSADKYIYNKANNKTIWLSKNNDNLGELFLGFLTYYSKIFNYKMIWIGSNSCKFEQFDLKDWRDSPVWIQDPFMPQKNIARTLKYHPPTDMTRIFSRAVTYLKNGHSYEDICKMKL